MTGMSKPMRRTKIIAAVLMVLLPGLAFTAGGDEYKMVPAMNDVSNIASLQRGAKYFVNYCLGCHSAEYVRYNRLAEDLSINEDQLVSNLMFAAEKPHETMQIAMPPDDAQRWFGQTPPDLSLIARSKGTDYLYGFLRSFYLDDSKPTGVNNLVLANASMPHVLWELQGWQQRIEATDEEGHKTVRLEQVSAGSLSADEYDQVVRDLVNFLDYIGEPMQLERQQLGIWVLLFLLVFGILSYLLKNEIWKDIKK